MAATEPAFAIGFAGRELDEDGHCLGFIRIGDFSEEFVVTLNYWPATQHTQQWHASLKRLLDGSPAVALVTWMVAPEFGDPGKAWILYREDDTVFVQEKLFVPPEFRPQLDADLQFLNSAADHGRRRRHARFRVAHRHRRNRRFSSPQ